MSDPAAEATLDLVMKALGATVATVATAPAGTDVAISSVALLDGTDLAESVDLRVSGAFCVLVGVEEKQACRWLTDMTRLDPPRRPTAVATKIVSAELVAGADQVGLALITIHPRAQTELITSTVRSQLHGAARVAAGGRDDEPVDGQSDLYGLAQTVASLTRGLVSIEDERARLLAYSATDGAADELRMLSILGREGPADYLRRLREWGVYERLRHQQGVVEVPADGRLGWRRRLVVGIRPLGEDGRSSGDQTPLGTIWIQEGRQSLDQDAGSVLEGAAVVAARLIERARRAPTQEALQIQRLLGLRGGGVDVPSLAAALSLPSTRPTTVIGIGPRRGGAGAAWSSPLSVGDVAAAVRLHASAYARESLVTTTDTRIYVVIPQNQKTAPAAWVGGMLDRLTRRTGLELRAAVAAPVGALADIGAARAEVDRVLDRSGMERVTTLAASRTSVLLGEVADLVAGDDQLRDPRLEALVADDRARDGSLLISVERYLDRFGDVRAAAGELHVHPNTLRYRIRRAEQVLGMRLDDPEDRLLLQIQILRWRRSG